MKLVTLGDVCKFQTGFNFKASKQRSEGLPILRIKNIQGGKIVTDGLVFFDPSEFKEDLSKYEIKPKDIVIALSGNTTGKVGLNKTDTVFFLNTATGRIDPDESKINRRWLYHFLLSKREELFGLAPCGTQPNLYFSQIEKIQFLLPPLSDQIRSAKILDKLLQLSEELSEELNLRKQQYEYYRDELLSFKQDNKIKWVTLGEITNKNYRGSFFPKNSILEHGDQCIRYAQLYEENRLHFDFCTLFTNKSEIQSPKYCEYGDILITATSNIGKNIAKACAYLGKDPALIDNICVVIKHNQNPKYLAYALSTTNAQKQKAKLSIAAGLFKITFDSIKKIKIPIPSLEKQEEIANLLDRFWELSNNIKDGLPAEILLSKQQYEYYRDKLLA